MLTLDLIFTGLATMPSSQKRKFEFNDANAEALSEQERQSYLQKINSLEYSTDDKPHDKKLASFWLPSLTPSATPDAVRVDKLVPMCSATDVAHPLS